MTCAWTALLSILPPWLKQEADKHSNTLQELRLRLGQSAELVCQGRKARIPRAVRPEDLQFVINAASRYSPWAAASSAMGYITAPGGHRIGLCGEAVVQNGKMTGIRTLRSLNIRVARDFPGIAGPLGKFPGSILILGCPGSGKTTLLRDLIRQRAREETLCVVDERGELFPPGMEPDCGVDILTGCPKAQGIDALIRTMTPQTLALDEITATEDCNALLQAGWCGVKLLATVHAASPSDLYSRPVYRPLVEMKLFDTLVLLQPDKSFRAERMGI